MKEGIVSIIMPVYNGEKFLKRSINSVLSQTYEKWELIIIDDQSADNSVAVVREFLNESRIHLLKNERNLGISGTRNKGIAHASGEYIALLDQDDKWLRTKLSKQVELLEELDEGYGLVYTNTKVVLNNKTLIERKRGIAPGDDIPENLKKLFLVNFISSLTVMFKRQCLETTGNFNELIQWGGDDYELWFRIARHYKFAFIDEVLAIRYEHGENFSHSKKKMLQHTLKMSEHFVSLEPSFARYIPQKKAYHYYYYALECFKTKQIPEGLYYMLKAFFTSFYTVKLLAKTIRNRSTSP